MTKQFRAFFVFGVAIMASFVSAEPTALNGEDITAALSGRTLESSDDQDMWRQVFREDGTTAYLSSGGRLTNGDWRVEGDRYCSRWPPSKAWSCYTVRGDALGVAFVSEEGRVWTGAYVE